MSEVKDRVRKLTTDAQRATMEAIDKHMTEAGRIAGPIGIYAVAQKLVGFSLQGAAMCLQAVTRGAQAVKTNRDDRAAFDDELLFSALLGYVTKASVYRVGPHEVTDEMYDFANDMFEKIMGRRMVIPEEFSRRSPSGARRH